MSSLIDLTGNKFGRLTVVKRNATRTKGNILWICECNCGIKTVISGNHLKSGHTKSCGCLQKEFLSQRRTEHGHTKNKQSSKTYQSWASMIQRCINAKVVNYCNYGGRRIKVAKRWRKFENFLKDMGEPPTIKHSIDRINNNGNYCKSNCRWATNKQQSRNKRNNNLITFNNKTMCLASWAEETGIRYETLQSRLRRGWPTEKTLITPVRKSIVS